MTVGTGDDAAFKVGDQDGAAVDGDADQVVQAIGVGQGEGTAGGIAAVTRGGTAGQARFVDAVVTTADVARVDADAGTVRRCCR
ncbi:hypothetical protein [Marinobacterium rhizophilum]|uniref:Uncharacterized protein n=1 Tax=Marinobacterium rhizophilum TaxID=420402 RepID=A0ABY5HHG1_9GAMM|nr:hypothetical protein [Marinobacterium rhizophilum]UTW11272.1 hypothetical protein KDW95_18700 [Marinobacterium rhizophilum]